MGNLRVDKLVRQLPSSMKAYIYQNRNIKINLKPFPNQLKKPPMLNSKEDTILAFFFIYIYIYIYIYLFMFFWLILLSIAN